MKQLGLVMLLSLLLLFVSMQNSYCRSFAISDEGVENRISAKIDSLNNASYNLNYANSQKAIALAEEALKLARDASYMPGMAKSFYNISIVYKNTGQYQKAIAWADTALYYYKLSGNQIGEAGVFNNLGTVYYYLAEFDKAINFYQKAHDIYQARQLQDRVGTMLNNLALAYTEQGDYAQALAFYFDALKLHEDSGNDEGIALALGNIGMVYANLRNPGKALDFYEKALEKHKLIDNEFGIALNYSNMANVFISNKEAEKAFEYYQMALELYTKNGDISNAAMTQTLIGYHYMTQGMHEEAIANYEEAFRLYEQMNDSAQLAYVSMNMGVVLQQMGHYSKALPYLERSQQIYTHNGNLLMLGYVYQALSQNYEAEGDLAAALSFFKKHFHLHDSLLNVESANRVAAAELQYIEEKKEAEIALLKAEKELQALMATKHKQSRNLFLVIAILVLIAIVLLLMRFRMKIHFSKTLEQKNKVLSTQQSEIQKQQKRLEKQYAQLKSLDDAKTRFFANISHEFRTPLTLIQGPLEDFIKIGDDHNFDDAKLQKVKLALRNSRQLNSLIDQLLDLSKLKAGKMKLRASRIELVAFLKRISGSFESAISPNKRISIKVESDKAPLYLHADVEKLEQVFNNLVSNAIKAIQVEGEIKLKVRDSAGACESLTGDGRFVNVDVIDNGIGIREPDLPQLFNRFFRADDSGLPAETGTGIGLEYSRELVDLHGGSVSVQSKYGEGSIFTVALPLGTAHLDEEELIQQPAIHTAHKADEALLAGTEVKLGLSEMAFTILLVEDHADMRQYIAGHLGAHYRVMEASNGQKALEILENEMPDLIVSDLMMPEMDGMALLRAIRRKQETEDLPFILLTAKAGDENRLAGYAEKADAYITKPFKPEELLLRIGNLLENRKRLEEKLSKKVVSIDLQTEKLPAADQQFVDRLRQTIVQHIHRTDFGIAELAGTVFLSERQFRRKLTTLTGMSPIDFIRQVRLLQAKTLIEQQAFETIAEVAHAVGFNNPAYFARLFKKLFGQAPNDWQAKS
jgi:signal transduction histidine kinase/DNA-binding response OmpR family regulator